MNRPARRRSSTKNQQQQFTTLNDPANNMATMDGANRKIELQSPEDLTYLINNVRRAAAEHIGAAFPPVEGDDAEEDELRVRIEGLVNDVRVLLSRLPQVMSLSHSTDSMKLIRQPLSNTPN